MCKFDDIAIKALRPETGAVYHTLIVKDISFFKGQKNSTSRDE